MSQERTEAVVLRSVDFSETSRIVTFLSPDRGRLACMAKGVKRPKSQLAALLDTFNRLELVYYWKDGRSVQQLGDVTLLDQYAALKADLDRAMYGAFPLEIAYKAAHENEPSEELYRVLVQGLEGLARWPGPARLHSCWQVMRLLMASGFEPALDVCSATGRPLSSAPGFSYAGGATASAGMGDRSLPAESLALLRALRDSAGACPDWPGDTSDVFAILRRYAAWQLESDFRSLRVLDQLFG